MKIKTHLFEIEIKPTDFFEECIQGKETTDVGSDIVKFLLDRGVKINQIKIEYEDNEKDE